MQDVAQAVELFVVLNLIVIGVSHIIAHQAWGEFFEKLVALGRTGAFANGLLTLVPGSMIVGFHLVWSGIPLIITLLGCCWMIKSFVILVFPDYGVRSMKRVDTQTSKRLIIPGVVMLVISALVLWDMMTTSAAVT